jgi:hypothetical protein
MNQAANTGGIGGPHQRRGCFRLGYTGRLVDWTVGARREMDDDFDAREMGFPIGVGAYLADRPRFDSRDRFSFPTRDTPNLMAALHQLAAQRAADKAGSARHQYVRQSSPPIRQSMI